MTDRDPFAALNSDPRVMEFFPTPLTRAESDAMADRCESLIHECGWGFWAAELKTNGRFIGFVGLHTPSAQLPFSPCVEIGWRLAYEHWGKGLASEAARGSNSCRFPITRPKGNRVLRRCRKPQVSCSHGTARYARVWHLRASATTRREFASTALPVSSAKRLS